MRVVLGMATRPTSFSDRSGFSCRCGRRCARLSLPLALSLPCASLGISIGQVGVAAPAVRAHHSKFHLLKLPSVQNDGTQAEERS